MATHQAGRGRRAEAEAILRRALALDPGHAAARATLAFMLHRHHRSEEALAELALLAPNDREPFEGLRAGALMQVGRYDEAVASYETMLARTPCQAELRIRYGHALRTIGRLGDAIAAYRRVIALAPQRGAAWWSLANLKTLALDRQDVAAMTGALTEEDLGEQDRCLLTFALAKAWADLGNAETAFAHYAEANRLRRATLAHDPARIGEHVRRSRALFTGSFFAARSGQGSPAPDPIFVLGLPRAGSTLIEQILASHPLVEGTAELPDMPRLARGLSGAQLLGSPASAYPERLAELAPDQLRALGETYLKGTRVHRKTDRPYFVDKTPSNWLHVGLIRLILPNAKIIDARRHPLACGLSLYRQYFEAGQAFSYDLAEIGRFYRDYVELMAHFDAVLPGTVHRVVHETLVESPEAEIRRLLDHLGLPFDPACLRFHETERAVRTASSEQVRRPLNRDGLDQWRAFEPWLGPLKTALGSVLDLYPEPLPLL